MIKESFHPEAEIEFIEAARYYESEAPGLGITFINEIRKAVAVILINPQAFTPIGRRIRKKSLQRFPYNLLYFIDNDILLILAVMHQKRRPNYWINRLESLPKH
ncbi:type II toxin-antitoxin system RelE/ParE family toxin [Candidatus Desantisbacteria bacterium]|nr:type II toxin-antitoxin system RelE/ParE family toxin [Candidatus Desantisbacteria bacterium]